MEEDAVADRPIIAASSISKARYRNPGSSTAPDVSAGSRAVRTQGRFAPPSLPPSSLAGAVRATTNNEDILLTETNPTPNQGGGLPRPPPFTTA